MFPEATGMTGVLVGFAIGETTRNQNPAKSFFSRVTKL
jgi:hypothetical protein